MTALPKKRISSSRQGKRRSHQALEAPPLMDCPQCRRRKMQHHVCPHCGFYKGRQVLAIDSGSPSRT